MGRLIDADLLSNKINHIGYVPACVDCMTKHSVLEIIDAQPAALEGEFELRLLKNFLYNMPMTYGKRKQNWCVVRDLLMSGTSTAGMTSCIAKCRELGINPYGHNLGGAVKDE